MNEKDNEYWIKRLRERLDAHEEPISSESWQKIESELSRADKLSIEPRRIPLYRRILPYAATIALLLGAIALWQLFLPQNQIQKTSQTISNIKKIQMESSRPSSVSTSSVIARVITHNTKKVQPTSVTTSSEPFSTDTLNTENHQTEAVEQHQSNKIIVSSAQKTNEQPVAESKSRSLPRHPSPENLPTENISSEHKPFVVGVLIGSSPTSNGVNDVAMDAGPSTPVYFTSLFSYKDNNIKHYPAKSLNHRLPISVGISVRKGLTSRLALESGLVYTLLLSDSKYSSNETQRLHYIGIPIKVSWSFLNSHKFQFYLVAGGMAEKCIYGKFAGEKITVKPIQFSIQSGVGVQYSLSNKSALYFEPGVVYYFDDGSNIQTIRKKSPFNANLQIGLRFSY